jgi:YNFM family putative membrane transporter
MWFVGLATFVLVYCVQAQLPIFAAEFGVSSSVASLALSACTGMLALAIVPLSAVAESWGRTRVMTAALAVSAVLGLVAPLAPTFGVLVVIRAVQGVALAALPALAMAHIAREVAPRWLGGALGLLIASNTIGGLSGRIVAGVVTDYAGWRVALAVVGGVSLICTVAYRLLLPPEVAPTPPRVPLRGVAAAVRAQLRDPGLRRLFVISFLLMSSFVSVYNYLGFRLIAPPFGLPVALVGLVFLGYLGGTWACTGAGRLGDRWGRRRVLWPAVVIAVAGAWLMLPDRLPTVLVGLVVVTIGFFSAHTLASSWVGRRSSQLPDGSPAVASSIYLFAYYAGTSLGGTLGGLAFDAGAWPGLVAYVTVLLGTALFLALALRRLPAPVESSGKPHSGPARS